VGLLPPKALVESTLSPLPMLIGRGLFGSVVPLEDVGNFKLEFRNGLPTWPNALGPLPLFSLNNALNLLPPLGLPT
jgi:hypothetical protein